MQFLTESHTPPEGTPKYIKAAAYPALMPERAYYYEPEWKEYITKKVRDYNECECCGTRRFTGWVERQIPVGEPWRYIYCNRMVPYIAYKSMIDSLLNPNILVNRILNPKLKGKW
jgi:hypothetical protein